MSGSVRRPADAKPLEPRFELRLLVSGASPRSVAAIERIRRICERHLKGRYFLDVIDLYLHPDAARTENVVAAPTLIRHSPLPVRRIVGDMNDEERVLKALRGGATA
jgi:circadian clock protein KaiB